MTNEPENFESLWKRRKGASTSLRMLQFLRIARQNGAPLGNGNARALHVIRRDRKITVGFRPRRAYAS